MTTATRTKTPVVIECLPASYGDAILVLCHRPRQRPWTLLVDTGPAESWSQIRTRLLDLPAGDSKLPHLDLLIISHVDHDHIGAAHHLLNEPALSIGDVWFNGEQQLEAIAPGRSIAEGQRFNDLLAFEPGPSWNAPFRSGPIVTSSPGAYHDVPIVDGAPTITLLSPNPKALTSLARKWKRELLEPEPTRGAPSKAGPIRDLEALAATPFVEDRSVANSSSIALLLEHAGTSVALLADAAARVITPALRNLAKDRSANLPLQVDAIKISHHGSRKNTSNDLLATIQARHYLISTDGSRHGGHPDDETIARIVTRGGIHPTIWFNYDTPIVQRWNPENLDAAWPYQMQCPTEALEGSVVVLTNPLIPPEPSGDVA